MFSVNDNSDYKGYKSGTKLPFVPSSRSPSRVSYMYTTFSMRFGFGFGFGFGLGIDNYFSGSLASTPHILTGSTTAEY